MMILLFEIGRKWDWGSDWTERGGSFEETGRKRCGKKGASVGGGDEFLLKQGGRGGRYFERQGGKREGGPSGMGEKT